MTERHSKAAHDTPGRRRLNAVDVFDDGNASGDVARPIVDRQPQTRREIHRIAAGVWIDDPGRSLLVVPLAVELEHRIKCDMGVGSGCGRCFGYLPRMWTSVSICAAGIMRVGLVGSLAEHPIDQCGV